MDGGAGGLQPGCSLVASHRSGHGARSRSGGQALSTVREHAVDLKVMDPQLAICPQSATSTASTGEAGPGVREWPAAHRPAAWRRRSVTKHPLEHEATESVRPPPTALSQGAENSQTRFWGFSHSLARHPERRPGQDSAGTCSSPGRANRTNWGNITAAMTAPIKTTIAPMSMAAR